MKTILAVLVLTLSGCATPPQWLANHYDRNDPCQTGQFTEAERLRLNRPVGYQQPSWCGASNNRVIIYSAPRGAPVGNAVGYIKK